MFSRGAFRAVVVAAAGACLAIPAAAGAAVLHDQNNNPAINGVTSQFGTGAPNADVQAADDFDVPAGQIWTIGSVDVTGFYNLGNGPVQSVNVYVYHDQGNLPGIEAFARKNIIPSNGLTGPSFSAPVNGAPLAGGHKYWLSFQVNLNDYQAEQWYWQNRVLQSGSPAAFRDTAGTLFSGCTSFMVRSAPGCPGPAGSADEMFRLNGVATAAKKKCKKKKKGKRHAAVAKKKKKCKKKK